MHIAETKDQAIDDCVHGLQDFANYFGGGAGFVPLADEVDGEPKTGRDYVEAYAEAPAASSSARPTTPSSTSRACSSSRAASARS